MSLSQIRSIITFRQENEPAVKVEGDVWLNTRTKVVQTWNGSSWDLNWKGYGLYGYSIGGWNSPTEISSVERFNFPFNAGVSNKVGEVSVGLTRVSGCNSTQYAYISCDVPALKRVFRFEFPFDSGVATQVGTLNEPGLESSSSNSSQHGYFMGGSYGTFSYHSSIERITFPFNSGVSTKVGNLSASKMSTSSCNSSSQAYIFGGTNSVSPDYAGTNIISRITFPWNSGTANDIGLINMARSKMAGFNSSQHGYTAGGWFRITGNNVYVSFIERISFPWNSGFAVIEGNSSYEGYKTASCNSSRYGYMMGGYNGSIYYSTIDRVQFPFNSGSSSALGSLTGSRYENAGVDECDFVNQFV